MLVYAIDFGTSNSLLAAADGNRLIEPIPLDPDSADPSILRSVLYFPSMKEVYYGRRAIKEFEARDMTGRLIRSIKKFLPVRSFIGTFIDDRPMNLEDIIGAFLREMRKRANEHFGQDVKSAVFGRPARFSPNDEDDQFAQYRLERAARTAGFEHIEFLAEPVAAAREFRHGIVPTSGTGSKTGAAGSTTHRQDPIVLVADFGGGTSDYTVIRGTDVLSIGGVALAGDALDGAVMRNKIAPFFGSTVEYRVPFGSNVLTMPRGLMERICSPADISLLRKRDTIEFFRNVKQWALTGEDKQRMDQLFSLLEDQLGFAVFEEIERTKRALSEHDSTEFKFTYPGVEIRQPVTRQEFEGFIAEPTRRILESLDETVQAAGLRFDQIDLVCCTGGTARVPVLRRSIEERFGKEKVRDHDYFRSVVLGLADRARELT